MSPEATACAQAGFLALGMLLLVTSALTVIVVLAETDGICRSR